MGDYSYHSLRARKARAGNILNNRFVRLLLFFVGFCGMVYWVYSVFFGKTPLGWLFFSLAVICFMILPWSKSELFHVPLGDGNSINDVLSANVILVLGEKPTPLRFAQRLGKTRSGSFLAIRFGLNQGILEMVAKKILSDEVGDGMKIRATREMVL